MFRVAPTLALALVCACSFNSFSGGRNEGLGNSSNASDDTGGNKPSVSGTRGVADGGEGDGEEGGESGPPPGTSGPELPGGDDEGSRVDLGGPVTTGDEEGMPGDCSMPSTFELHIEDANVVAPMVTEHVPGIGLAAYSTESNEGDLVFTIDVDCPGTYYLHGYVLDWRGGVNQYDDPDSFVLSWPGGEGTWFYGCQTDYADWFWLPVLTGVAGQPCDSAVQPQIQLAAGQHTITVHNREGGEWYWGDYIVAAIARLVVTSDPDWVGM